MEFTDIEQTLQYGNVTIAVTIEPDNDHGAPWEECDGYGPVSDWTRRDKLPGELVLNSDRTSKRFYDFAEACRIARRDGWGVRPYRVYPEQGANGLTRLTGHWFDHARNLECIVTDWHDCQNAARSQLYAMHRATMSEREYAARAARQDYERLRDWCNDHWHYVGVIVTATDSDGEEIDSCSLWGIESDAGDFLLEVANELLGELLPSFPSHRVMLAADIGV